MIYISIPRIRLRRGYVIARRTNCLDNILHMILVGDAENINMRLTLPSICVKLFGHSENRVISLLVSCWQSLWDSAESIALLVFSFDSLFFVYFYFKFLLHSVVDNFFPNNSKKVHHIGRLLQREAQDCNDYDALAMALLQSYRKPSIYGNCKTTSGILHVHLHK